MTEHALWSARLDTAERCLAELQHELDRKDAAFSKQAASLTSPKNGLVGSQKLSMPQKDGQQPLITSISVTPSKAAAMHRVVSPRRAPSPHAAAATLAVAAASKAAEASLDAVKAAATAQATAITADRLKATAQRLSPTKDFHHITSFPIQNFDSTTSSSLNSTVPALCPSIDDVVIHEKQEQMEAALNKARQLGCVLHSRDNDLKTQLNHALAAQIAAQAVAKAKDDLLQTRQQELAVVRADCFRLVEEVQNLRIENKTLHEEKAVLKGQLVNQQQLETELAIMKAEVASLTAQLVKAEELSLLDRPLCARCGCKQSAAARYMSLQVSPGCSGLQHSATARDTDMRVSHESRQAGGRRFIDQDHGSSRRHCDSAQLPASTFSRDVSAQQCEQVLKATQKLQDALVSTTDSMALLRERSKAAESSLAAQDLLIQQLRADDHALREQLRRALSDLAMLQSSAAVHGVHSPSQSPHAQVQQHHNASTGAGAANLTAYPISTQSVNTNARHCHPAGLQQVNTSQPTLLSPFTLPPDLSVATSAYPSQNGHGVCIVGRGQPGHCKQVSKVDVATLQRYQQALANLQAAQQELLTNQAGAIAIPVTEPTAGNVGGSRQPTPVLNSCTAPSGVGVSQTSGNQGMGTVQESQQGLSHMQGHAARGDQNTDKTYLAEVSAQLAAKTTELARHRADLLSAAQMMEDSQALQAQLAEQLQRTTEELNRVTVLVQTQQPSAEPVQTASSHHTKPSQKEHSGTNVKANSTHNIDCTADTHQTDSSAVRHAAELLPKSEVSGNAKCTTNTDGQQSQLRQQQDSLQPYSNVENNTVDAAATYCNKNSSDPLGLSMLAARPLLHSPAQRQLQFTSSTEINKTASVNDAGEVRSNTGLTTGSTIQAQTLHVPADISSPGSQHPLNAQHAGKPVPVVAVGGLHSAMGGSVSATEVPSGSTHPSMSVAAKTNHGMNTDNSDTHEDDMRVLLDHLDLELAALASGVADREAVTTSLLSRMAAARKMLGKQPAHGAQNPTDNVQAPNNASNTAERQQAPNPPGKNAGIAPTTDQAPPLSPMQSAASKHYTIGGISIAPPSSVCSPTHGRYMGGSHRQWSQASMQYCDSDGGADTHQGFSRFESNASKETVIHHIPGESYSTYAAPSVATTMSDKDTSDKGHSVGAASQTQVHRVLSNAADAVKAASAARAAKPHLMKAELEARQDSFGKVHQAGPSRMSPRITSRGPHSSKPYHMPSTTSWTLEGSGAEAELAERMAGLDQALKALVSDP